MEIAYVIVFLGLLIFLSHLFSAMFGRTRIPNALLLLLIGVLVGPVTSLITKEDFGQLGGVFTTITLIVILFESGINLKLEGLKKTIGTATALTVLNFILAMGVMTVLFYYLTDIRQMGYRGWISAAFLGAILGGTSSAVVIPMVKQLKLGKKAEGVLVLESALSDVLCLVVGLALIDSMHAWEVDFVPLFNRIWQSFLFAIFLGLLAGYFWLFTRDRLPKMKNSFFTNLAFTFIVYGLTELAGFNGGIATLAFGVVIGNADTFLSPIKIRRHLTGNEIRVEPVEQLFYTEMVFILQTYFFVYIGINIQFGHPVTYLVALLAVGLNIILRAVTVGILPRRNLDYRDRSVMAVMTPKGLVPAVLASIPLYHGIQSGEIIQEATYAVVFVSILITSFLVMVMERARKKPVETAITEENPDREEVEETT